MDAHLDEHERLSGNRRNGHTPKQVQTSLGEVTVHTPRNWESTFESEFIEKRERTLAKVLPIVSVVSSRVRHKIQHEIFTKVSCNSNLGELCRV